MQESIQVSWLTDQAAASHIINSAEIAPFVLEGDSFSVLPPDSNLRYLGVYKETTLVGLFIFVRRLKYMWEVHTCLTSQCRGKLAIIAGKLAMQKLFADIDLVCLSTFVPASYLHVQSYTTRMGFTLVGVIPKCFYHDGMQDCFLYAITKEEAASCLQQQ